MARKTKGVPKMGVNISLTAAEKAAVEARAERAYISRVTLVRAALERALRLDARAFGVLLRKLHPARAAGEKSATVLYVELPDPLFTRAANKVGETTVADLCRRALTDFLADPLATLS